MLEEAQLLSANHSNLSSGCNSANRYGTPGSCNPSYHQCSHSYPHCNPPPYYHCSHHTNNSHSLPYSQPETFFNQKHMLEEIKKSVDNVTACVLGIADIVTKPTDITADNVTTHVASEEIQTNRVVITTNEADDFTYDNAGNESMASFDGSVPDLPSLNSQNPTSQLQQLMPKPQPELTQIPPQ